MGLPASVWFVIALVALLLGAGLLFFERRRTTGTSRDRQRWAALREWEFLDEDPVLPGRWRYGTIHQGGPGVAKDLVSGWLPNEPGRRRIYVFDHEQHGTISSVIVGVETTAQLSVAIELRLATSARPPDDVGLEGHGPVGKRIAFVSDTTAAQPLITPRLAAAADAVGDDIELIWAEDSWVLAAAPVGSDTDRIQDLLLDLVEVATALERTPERPSPGSTRTERSDNSTTSSTSTPSPYPSSSSSSSTPPPSSSAPASPPSPSPRPVERPEGLDFLRRES
jgi:hypothetical protein